MYGEKYMLLADSQLNCHKFSPNQICSYVRHECNPDFFYCRSQVGQFASFPKHMLPIFMFPFMLHMKHRQISIGYTIHITCRDITYSCLHFHKYIITHRSLWKGFTSVPPTFK